MRLGFAVKPLGRPELKSHDTRRWQNQPHLSVSLAYLRDIIGYLAAAGISMYRMSPDLAPYVTHPELPQFHGQIEACAAELAEVGRLAKAADIRLSFHPGQHVVLNAADPTLAGRSAATVTALARILDGMGLGAEAVVIVHLGGVYEDAGAARERFVRAFEALPEVARRRLALENDDIRFSVTDVLWAHQRTGVPLVFDYLHHRLNNPERQPVRWALAACLATWPAGTRPKVHFSSPRTEWRVEEKPDAPAPLLRQSRWAHHSDYVNPFEFIDFMAGAEGLPAFDVMLEARGRDLAVLQLQEDLARYAPELAERLEPQRPGARNPERMEGRDDLVA